MSTRININLLPWREEVKEQLKKEFVTLLALGALLAIGMVLGIHLWISGEIHFQQEQNAFLTEEISKLDKKIAQIDALKKEKQQLLAKMEVIQELQANRPQIVRLFDGIVKTVPEGLYLNSLSRKGDDILIEGKAESNTRVSAFMRNLESSTWLQKPMLSLIQADDKDKDNNTPAGQKSGKSLMSNPYEHLIGFNLKVSEVSKSNPFIQKTAADVKKK